MVITRKSLLIRFKVYKQPENTCYWMYTLKLCLSLLYHLYMTDQSMSKFNEKKPGDCSSTLKCSNVSWECYGQFKLFFVDILAKFVFPVPESLLREQHQFYIHAMLFILLFIVIMFSHPKAVYVVSPIKCSTYPVLTHKHIKNNSNSDEYNFLVGFTFDSMNL